MTYRRADLIRTYSPRYYKLAAKRSIRYEQRTMVLATMVVLWDVLVQVIIVAGIVALLLLGLLSIAYGLAALYWLSQVQLAS